MRFLFCKHEDITMPTVMTNQTLLSHDRLEWLISFSGTLAKRRGFLGVIYAGGELLNQF